MYSFILINYPDCVQCAIISLTTFTFFKGWLPDLVILLYSSQCPNIRQIQDQIFHIMESSKGMKSQCCLDRVFFFFFFEIGNNAIYAVEGITVTTSSGLDISQIDQKSLARVSEGWIFSIPNDWCSCIKLVIWIFYTFTVVR